MRGTPRPPRGCERPSEAAPRSTTRCDSFLPTTPAAVGALLYMFEKGVAVGGRLLGVNPFDQPGVEAYKRAMFRLLGKPGA